jgi:hypothetical protein
VGGGHPENPENFLIEKKIVVIRKTQKLSGKSGKLFSLLNYT